MSNECILAGMRRPSDPLFLLFLMTGVAVCALVPRDTAARPKTDVVRLANGDRITCEILQLSRGKLKVKTDSAGTIEIEWKDITGLNSQYYYRVVDIARTRYFGEIELVEGKSVFRIANLGVIATLEKSNVVE
ncbi:MAG: hypothetical protein P8181_12640, partial [bacterium]